MTAFGPYPKRSAVRLKSPSNLRPDALRIAPMVRPGPYILEVVLFVSVTMENETLEGSWLSRGPRLASAVAVDACESCRRWAINTSVDHAGDSRPNERVREQDSARVHLTIYIAQSKLSWALRWQCPRCARPVARVFFRDVVHNLTRIHLYMPVQVSIVDLHRTLAPPIHTERRRQEHFQQPRRNPQSVSPNRMPIQAKNVPEWS
jgi:hypothetical protein